MDQDSSFVVTPRTVLGIAIVLLGFALTLDRLGVAPANQLLRFWPVPLILMGALMIVQARDGRERARGWVFTGIGSWFFLYSQGIVSIRIWEFFWPVVLMLIGLSLVTYANFFADHFGFDARLLLFALAAFLFGRTVIHFKVWRTYRNMPLLLGLVLVSLFIWISENIGTYTKTWLYPSQHLGWSMVSPAKLGSWFLLVIVSYTLVSLINAPRSPVVEDAPARSGSTTTRQAA